MKYEHIAQIFLMVFWKSAALCKLVDIFKTEQAVPPSNVAIIESVDIDLFDHSTLFEYVDRLFELRASTVCPLPEL